jgi:hypothetical protein
MGMTMQRPRALRLREVLERDGATCLWCGRAFDRLVAPTTDHLVPRVKGGPSWSENEAAACRRCNSARGHMAPVAWSLECERRGWVVDQRRLVTALLSLKTAIDERGGQRRARGYLDGQLRRLHR